MVADQESARPLLDAAEICKLAPKEMILLVAGFPPIRARRLKYYQHPQLAQRAGLPPVTLKPGGPYPYRPPPHPNPWAGKGSPRKSANVAVASPVAAPTSPPTDTSESASSEHSGRAIALPATQTARESEEEVPQPGRKRAKADIEQQLELLTSEEELMRRRALDEFEREQTPHPRIRRRIPF
jgi:type IV secretion system protein VirD4